MNAHTYLAIVSVMVAVALLFLLFGWVGNNPSMALFGLVVAIVGLLFAAILGPHLR